MYARSKHLANSYLEACENSMLKVNAKWLSQQEKIILINTQLSVQNFWLCVSDLLTLFAEISAILGSFLDFFFPCYNSTD